MPIRQKQDAAARGRTIARDQRDIHARKREEEMQRVRQEAVSAVDSRLARSALHRDVSRVDDAASDHEGIGKLLPQAIVDYNRSLTSPWHYQARVPWSPNNVKTENSMVPRTFALNTPTVTLNTCDQYMMFPGHSAAIDGLSLRSAPTNYVQINGTTNFVPGPVANGVSAAASVFLRSGLAVSAASASLAASTSPINYAVQLPFNNIGTEASAGRWRLVSFGVKILNKTVALDRGGYVVSVCPDSEFLPSALQQEYMRFKSFTLWGTDTMCCDAHREDHIAAGENFDHPEVCPHCGEEDPGWITWIPRDADASYYHLDAASQDPTPRAAGLLWWLNADGAKTQTYVQTMVWNWELAGTTYRSMTTTAVHHPMASEIMPPALGMVRNSGPTAKGVGATAAVVAATRDTNFNGILHRAVRAAKPLLPSSIGGVAKKLGTLGATLAAVLGEPV